MRFAERYGYVSAKKTIQIEGMESGLRNALWNLLTEYLFPSRAIELVPGSQMRSRVKLVWGEYFKLPIDNIGKWWGGSGTNQRTQLRDWFFKSQWYLIYDFVEFCFDRLIEDRVKGGFEKELNKRLEVEHSGYRIVGGKFARITSDLELECIDAAQQASGVFDPVSIHIRAALGHLTRHKDPDYRNSIKESISAVEAACCIITGDSKATLGLALKNMEKKGFQLHSAQKEAFLKLYGYTSDADGIRHALLDEETLTYNDAQFMLISCSAFVNFLISTSEH